MILNRAIKRTLTYKSVIGDDGKFRNKTVQWLLDNKELAYLQWIYCTFEKYDFIPEILELLNIKDEFVIKKPGINKELLEQLQLKLRNGKPKQDYRINKSKPKTITHSSWKSYT